MYTGYISTDPKYVPLLESIGIKIIKRRNDHDFDCVLDREAYEKLLKYERSGMFIWKIYDSEGKFPK